MKITKVFEYKITNEDTDSIMLKRIEDDIWGFFPEEDDEHFFSFHIDEGLGKRNSRILKKTTAPSQSARMPIPIATGGQIMDTRLLSLTVFTLVPQRLEGLLGFR